MKTKTLVFILLLIVALVAIKFIFLKPENAGPPKGGPQKAPIAMVSAYIVKSEELETKLYASGSVKANEEVTLHPEMPGKLISLPFQEGSYVNKGTLLAKINDADLQAQLRKLEIQAKLAKEKVERLKGLLDIKGVSQEDYDVAQNQWESLSADMDYTKAQIAKTEIRAPFNGKIGLRQVSEGSFVNSSTSIASIQQSEQLKIDFTLPEKYSNVLAVGDAVHFTVESSKESYQAKVYAIEPRIDEQTRNIQVRAIYNNSNNAVYPGSFARVELVANKKIQALLIPTEAVIPELKGKKVYLIKSGKAKPSKVETGTRNDSRIEITSGINEGDTLIVTGIMSLKPDMDVKVVEIKK